MFQHSEPQPQAAAMLAALGSAIDQLRALAMPGDPLARGALFSVDSAIARAADTLSAAYLELDGNVSRAAGTAKGGLAGWQVRAILDFVERNLDKRIAIADLARHARISGSYLCRAFNATFNCSPMEFLRQKRIERAKSLLRQSQAPLCDIALHCGFADQAHFTRQFRAYVGATPRHWRLLHGSLTAGEG